MTGAGGRTRPSWLTLLARSMALVDVGRWAPRALTQPILPGWTIGPQLTINEVNSSSPAAEAAVVQVASYGRQLGRMAEVIEALLTTVQLEGDPRVVGFRALQQQIVETKDRVDGDDLGRARSALDRLRRTRPDAYGHLLRELVAAERASGVSTTASGSRSAG